MTEQPNTTAIRERFLEPGPEWADWWDYYQQLGPLCEALDAARGERDSNDSIATHWYSKWMEVGAEREGAVEFWRHWKTRAEAAEAELARVADDYAGLIVRCRAAEADLEQTNDALQYEREQGAAAEADSIMWRATVVSAEARIAAAMVIVEEMECDIPEDNGNDALHHMARGLRRALTEGTGQ